MTNYQQVKKRNMWFLAMEIQKLEGVIDGGGVVSCKYQASPKRKYPNDVDLIISVFWTIGDRAYKIEKPISRSEYEESKIHDNRYVAMILADANRGYNQIMGMQK